MTRIEMGLLLLLIYTDAVNLLVESTDNIKNQRTLLDSINEDGLEENAVKIIKYPYFLFRQLNA